MKYILAYLVLSAIIFGIYWLVKKIVKHFRKSRADADLERNFKQVARKARMKRIFLPVYLTLTALVVIFGIVMQLNSAQMEKLYFKTSNQADAFVDIQAPNVGYNNAYINDYGVFSSNVHLDTYKNLDGYHVAFKPLDFPFGTLSMYMSHEDYDMYASPHIVNNGYYTQNNNQKIASFFQPKVNFKSKDYYGLQPTHEASTFKNQPNELAEIAVTFKKPLTYAQIQALVPKNLLINWYWIGYSESKNLDAAYNLDYFGLNSDSKTVDNGNTDQLTGKLSAASYKEFVKNVKNWPTEQTLSTGEFNPLKDARKQVEKYPNLASAKFSGIILTGQTKNFGTLDSKTWVFATNVGLTTPIVPYVKPLK
ncbi:anti sigma factor C-terminal domain-containing protein [Lactococcus nasutitermitis]|uniref:Anti sigma factor C-terminal domain-containing protein n=1 Tax=Lactococcus nasutitermitis TaxID=1652957 RepID=A0ABV9JH01_9LACT|nr:anti sigma factor C-terminal domain-containing protein [Lactococcus nasutitermitis]